MKVKKKVINKVKQAQKKSNETIAKGEHDISIPKSVIHFFARKKYLFREANLQIPQGIEADFVKFASNKNNVGKEKFYPNDISWIYAIAFILTFVRINQIATKYDEVRLSNALLKHLFGSDVIYVKKFLVERGYLKLVRVGSAQARRCNGYLLGDDWVERTNWRPYYVKRDVKKTHRYKQFKKKFLKGLAILEDQVIGQLVNDEQFNSGVIRKVRNDNSKIKERINAPHKNGRMDAAGRFHSVFTNIPKSIRRKMKFANRYLVEIDVASCQPILLAALYGDNKKTESGKTLYFEKERLTQPESIEKRKYIDLCQSSYGFYESLGVSKSGFGFTMFGHLSGKAWFGLKMIQELKKRGFHILVGRLYALRQSLKSYKKDGKVTYGLMARVMQRWESFLMIDKSLTKMDFGAIPIHDAVLVKREDTDKAMKIIADNFTRFLGISRTVFKVINYQKKALKRYVFGSKDAMNEWKERQEGSRELIFNS